MIFFIIFLFLLSGSLIGLGLEFYKIWNKKSYQVAREVLRSARAGEWVNGVGEKTWVRSNNPNWRITTYVYPIIYINNLEYDYNTTFYTHSLMSTFRNLDTEVDEFLEKEIKKAKKSLEKWTR